VLFVYAIHAPDAREDLDAPAGEDLGHAFRYHLVLPSEDARRHLQQTHLGAERREDGSKLATRRGGADDHDRRGQTFHRPDVAVGYGMFGAGEVHSSGVAAGAEDEPLARDAGAVAEF
jgi:hypothetical protein